MLLFYALPCSKEEQIISVEEKIKNELKYYLVLSILTKFYEMNWLDKETIKKVNQKTAKDFNCILIECPL